MCFIWGHVTHRCEKFWSYPRRLSHLLPSNGIKQKQREREFLEGISTKTKEMKRKCNKIMKV
jgi:hypothetical protein